MADYIAAPSVVLAADTVDTQQGLFSKLEDAVTKGIPAAAISGAMSIYNTFLDYSGKEAHDTGEAIRNFDQNTGDFYDANKEVVDIGGFVATSLIPGSLGAKGLKLLQSGRAEGVFARATNFLPSRKDKYLQDAIRAMGPSGGTITSDIIAAQRSQLVWATADNALTATASELAIALTMNDSPIFDNATPGDFVSNIVFGAAFGGVVGGLLDHAAARGVIKSAQRTVEKNLREFDVIFNPEKLGLSASSEAMNFLEGIIKAPEDVAMVPFSYKIPGTQNSGYVAMDTSTSFSAARRRAEKVAFDTVALKFNELAGGGEVTGQAMHGFVYKLIQEGRVAGESAESIADNVRGYLQNIKRVTNVAENATEQEAPKQFFLTLKPKGFDDLFSETRHAGTGKQAYYLTTDDASKIKTAGANSGFKTAQEAFDAGFDLAVTKAGRMAVNPKSTLVRSTPDAALNTKFYLDLESGKLSPEVVVTAADTLKRNSDFVHLKDKVVLAGKEFPQPVTKAASLKESAVTATARAMWASKLDHTHFLGRVIEWNDFPMLDRLGELNPTLLQGKKAPDIHMPDGTLLSFNELVSPHALANEMKLNFIAQGLAESKYDLRHIAAVTNTTRSWVEDVINSGFAPNTKLMNFKRDLAENFKPTTLMLEWDPKLTQVGQQLAGPLAPGHQSTVILQHLYELKTQQSAQLNAFNAAFGKDARRFMDIDPNLANTANSGGAGASTFTSSNADYGSGAALAVQERGKMVALVSKEWRDETILGMAPHINAIRDDLDASAELGVITTALRRDARKYVFVSEQDEVGDTVHRLVDREAKKLYENPKFEGDLDEAIDQIKMGATKEDPIRGEYAIKSKKVTEFLQSSTGYNADRLDKLGMLHNAAGLKVSRDPNVVYVPPIDTARYPFHAFVVAKQKIGAITDVAMITAKDAEQLRNLAKDVGDDYEVIYKSDTKRYFESKGLYDYDMTMNESRVNSSLQRSGKLGDMFPETRAANVLEDYVRWHANSTDNLVRTGVQVRDRQFFSELQWLSERFRDATESTAGGRGFLFKKSVADPFGDYIKTALNIDKRSEHPLLDSLNEFVDKMGTTAYKAIDKVMEEFRSSKGKDLVALEEANKLADAYGLGTPYKTMEQYLVANEKVPKNLIRTAFQKANMFLATGVLRLDMANALVNMISTPILLGTELRSIRSAIGQDSELAGKLRELTRVKVPGQQASIPSNTALIGQAIQNFFGPDKEKLLARYTDNGDIKTTLALYHEVLNDLSYMPSRAPSEWATKVEAAVEKGAKITGNEFAEQFTRFVAADVMRQLTAPVVAAKKMTEREANAYISSFVNRVQGNYISSQRPVLFQGTTGAAIGLFQTYSFNVLQQLFRHMENRDTRALLTFTGLQTSVYGMNGLPFFDAINQHLVGNASGNAGHVDAYSILPAANKEWGNWLLYGTASAFPLFGDKMPALYSRGDINPRHLTIVPINPIDIPAVGASIKLVDAIAGFGKNVAKGADISESMLLALEHHGINRPLAGFAQLLSGQSTTSKGTLISAASDMQTTSMLAAIPERMVNFGGVSRLMGARPMDEAVALSQMYRNKAYEAVDRARIEALGGAVKTKLYANQMPDQEEMEGFMHSYVRSGGRIEGFSSSLQRWSKDANTSIVNQMTAHLGKPSSQRLMQAMGGEKLNDYSSLAGMPAPEEE